MSSREGTEVDLTAFVPAECPRGHVLRAGRDPAGRFLPRRVRVSFAMCSCPPAREGVHGAWGHVAVACQACEGERFRSVCYDPPCDLPDSAPGIPALPGPSHAGSQTGNTRAR